MVNFDSLIQNRLENKTRINAQKSVFMEELQSVRKLVNKKLDEMEKCLRDTMESDVKEVGFDLDNLWQDLNVHKSNIGILKEELKAAVSIATDLQVFIGLRPLKLRLEEEHSYLETLKTNKAMDEVDFVLDLSPTVTAIYERSETFGVISQSRKSNELELGVGKREQAQLLLPSLDKLSNFKFYVEAHFLLPTGENGIDVLGCTVLPRDC
ncbi:unnamed protein product [Mytilus edulis]|uniref:Uncharacterized protein n=1 Tax=Mytilus edulis TaxID=6550 RepID=A0A8S3U1S1_MYTED|nr:unnamed protein product [Mytilus edulis]